MSQQPRVPKFGNWEGDSNVPYTQYFDNARRSKTTGKLINPNDPQENPESFSQDTPVRASPSRISYNPEAPGSRNGDVHRPTASPQHRRGVRDRKSRSGGSDHSVEQSPLHYSHQAKGGSRMGMNSPSWERKGSEGHGIAPNTPGRARTRLGDRENQTPVNVSAVPKFGEWDEGDPASADSYTHIFNKVREERQDGSARIPPARNSQKPDSNDEPKGCCGCFGW